MFLVFFHCNKRFTIILQNAIIFTDLYIANNINHISVFIIIEKIFLLGQGKYIKNMVFICVTILFIICWVVVK